MQLSARLCVYVYAVTGHRHVKLKFKRCVELGFWNYLTIKLIHVISCIFIVFIQFLVVNEECYFVEEVLKVSYYFEDVILIVNFYGEESICYINSMARFRR